MESLMSSKYPWTLTIGDIHEPFAHRRALAHCLMVQEEAQTTRTRFVGDIIDHHRISRHTTEPDAMGATLEARQTIRKLAKWVKAFPEADIILGNHDLIPKRQAKEVGIPDMYLKDIREVYQLPDTWKFHDRIIEKGVLWVHDGGSGKYAAMNLAKDMSMSVVCAHTHRYPGCLYFSNPNKLFFALQTGCLIDKKAYAMRYSTKEVTLGCAVVYSPWNAQFWPMKMS